MTGRRLSALTLAVAVTAGSFALGAGPAAAPADARTVIGVVTEQDISRIDPDRTVDLTIRKARPNPYDQPPLSSEGKPLAPLGGSVFTVSRVSGVDLRTQEGWDTARGMTLAQARAVHRLADRVVPRPRTGPAHHPAAHPAHRGRAGFELIHPGRFLDPG